MQFKKYLDEMTFMGGNRFKKEREAVAWVKKNGQFSRDYYILQSKKEGWYTVLADEAYLYWPMSTRDAYVIKKTMSKGKVV